MPPFDVKRSARKCCKTEQPLRPGEAFYSALVDSEHGFVRQDYSAEAWQTMRSETDSQDPAGQLTNDQGDDIIGWWKQRIPELESGKIYWAPDDVQVAYFNSLYEQSQEDDITGDITFVLALLLVQKRLLMLDDHDDSGTMHLVHRKSGKAYEIAELNVPPDRIAAIQNRLAENLFSDQPAQDGDQSDGNEP